jgi:hypothetical protein
MRGVSKDEGGPVRASWFETRGVAALLTMRVEDLVLRSARLRASRSLVLRSAEGASRRTATSETCQRPSFETALRASSG